MSWEDKKMEDDGIGYHKKKIEKGTLGQFSKIREEFEEMQDALEQGVHVMALVEASDLIGAIEAWAKGYGLSLTDLLRMKDVTKRAFESGRRTAEPRKPKAFLVDDNWNIVGGEIVLPEIEISPLNEVGVTDRSVDLPENLYDLIIGSEIDS